MTRPAPIPPDTRAKGWRLELDPERIEQSDAWTLAPFDIRPWLLALHFTAWKQVPCGSLPNDDELIAAKIGMPFKTFTKVRSKLMRDWWHADDGRLYNDMMADRVLEMLAAKQKDRDRKAAYRARLSGGRPELSHGTDTGPTPDDGGNDATGTSTGTGTGTGTCKQEKKPRSRASAPAVEKPEDVDQQTWGDWTALRKAKRAPVTATVLAEARKEADKANLTLDRFLAVLCARGSQGLQADWLKPHERGAIATATNAATFAERDREAGWRRWEEMTGQVHPDRARAANTNVIDITPAPLALEN